MNIVSEKKVLVLLLSVFFIARSTVSHSLAVFAETLAEKQNLKNGVEIKGDNFIVFVTSDTLIGIKKPSGEVIVPAQYKSFIQPWDKVQFYEISKKIPVYDTLENRKLYGDELDVTEPGVTFLYPKRKPFERFYGIKSFEYVAGYLDKNFREIDSLKFMSPYNDPYTWVYQTGVDLQLVDSNQVILYRLWNTNLFPCVYDLNGKVIIPASTQLQSINPVNQFSSKGELKCVAPSYYRALKNLSDISTYIFFDHDGKKIGEVQGTFTEHFVDGKCPFMNMGKMGFIDLQCKEYYDGSYVIRYSDFIEEYSIADGKLHGTIKKYWDGGIMSEEITYANGAKNGIEKRYFSNGKINIESIYSNGKLNGITKEYHGNGQLKRETIYLDDLKDGIEKEYSETGKLISQKTFKAGKKIK